MSMDRPLTCESHKTLFILFESLPRGYSIIPVFLCISTSIYFLFFYLLAEAAESLLHYIPIASNATAGPRT